MRKYLFFFLFLFFIQFLFGQQAKIDSLQHLLEKSQQDTNRVILLVKLSGSLRSIDPDKALSYAEQAKILSEKLNYIKGIGNGWLSIGTANHLKGNYDTAISSYRKAMVYFKKIDNKSGISKCLNNIGNAFNYQAKIDSSIGYFIEALKICDELHDSAGVSIANINIGNIYLYQSNYEKAKEYYENAVKIDEKINNEVNLAQSYNNLGAVSRYMKDTDKAVGYYKKSLAIRYKFNNKEGIAENLLNLGDVFYHTKFIDSALIYLSNALVIYQEIGHQKGMTYALNDMATCYIEKKDFPKAISYLNQTIELGRKIGAKDIVQEAYKNLSGVYEIKEDYKNAYEFHKKYSDIKDSLLNEESSKQITEMQTKYETEKKEQQITLLNKDKELQDAQLNRQKIIIWSVVGGLLVVLILSFFIFRERRKAEKLLLNILPAETARELKENGKATARHYESVTVMFTDFQGFTTIAEKLSAEELVNELDFLFKKFDKIISKYNIEKIKTIGDAYMCAGGLPTANNTHAVDVVSAATEIQKWMQSNQDEKWHLRIGIHTGSVTAGVVGDKKFAYDIWGDTVNTASRMESSGEAGEINISNTTYELIKDKFKCDFRGKIPAKNKGEIEMYYVENGRSS